MALAIAAGAIYLATVAVFIWQLRASERRAIDALRLHESTVKHFVDERRQADERTAQERSELLTRIQAPKDAPFVLGMSADKQHVPLDDDEEYWAMVRDGQDG